LAIFFSYHYLATLKRPPWHHQLRVSSGEGEYLRIYLQKKLWVIITQFDIVVKIRKDMEQEKEEASGPGMSEGRYVRKLGANQRWRQRHREKMRGYKRRARERARAKRREERGGKVEVDWEGCWGWMGGLNEKGYGMVRSEGRTKRRVHRVMWERYRGKIPMGMVLHHRCQNRRCCNPEHLEMLTRPEHLAVHRGRGVLKDRCGKGHEFTPENTYKRSDGMRVCRECAKERLKKWGQGTGRVAIKVKRARYEARHRIQKILGSFGDWDWENTAARLLAPDGTKRETLCTWNLNFK
jgi:hypothetical protein